MEPCKRARCVIKVYPRSAREQHETLLQAAFKRQENPAEHLGLFWKLRQMAHLRTELASVCSKEGGWLQLPRKQAAECASWNSRCFSPEKVPRVPDDGFLLFGVYRTHAFANFLWDFFFSIPVSLCKVPRLFNTRPTSRLPSGPPLLPPLALLPPTKIV